MLRKTKLATLLLVVCFLPFAFAASASALTLASAMFQGEITAADMGNPFGNVGEFVTGEVVIDADFIGGINGTGSVFPEDGIGNFAGLFELTFSTPTGFEFTEADDLGFPEFPEVAFTGGLINGIDYFGLLIFEVMQVGLPGFPDLIFTIDDLLTGAGVSGEFTPVGLAEVKVPEPGTLLLLGSGLLGLAFMGRRFRKD